MDVLFIIWNNFPSLQIMSSAYSCEFRNIAILLCTKFLFCLEIPQTVPNCVKIFRNSVNSLVFETISSGTIFFSNSFVQRGSKNIGFWPVGAPLTIHKMHSLADEIWSIFILLWVDLMTKKPSAGNLTSLNRLHLKLWTHTELTKFKCLSSGFFFYLMLKHFPQFMFWCKKIHVSIEVYWFLFFFSSTWFAIVVQRVMFYTAR